MESLETGAITLAATTIAKVLVDVVRMTNKLPAWASPLLAVAFGVAGALLLLVAGDATFSLALAAEAVVTGIVAGGAAIGSTELQRREKHNYQLVAAELLTAPCACVPLPPIKEEPTK